MSKKRLFALATFFLSLFLSVLFFLFRDFFLRTKSLGLLGIFLVNLVTSASFFSPAPAFLTVVSGGVLYNPILVGIIASFGSALGDMVGYVFGHSGRDLAIHRLSKKFWFRIIEEVFKKHGTLLLFLFALIPNPLFDSIGIVAGIFGYSPKKFFAVVFVGRAIRFIILALIGSKI